MTTNDSQVYVAGSGRYLPPRSVDNYELYEMESIRRAFDVEMARASLRDLDPDEAAGLDDAEVFDRWSLQLTGIRRRRIHDPTVLRREHVGIGPYVGRHARRADRHRFK